MKKILLITFLVTTYLLNAQTDRDVLVALYNSTNGVNWINPWDLMTDYSTWEGVQTNVDGRVTGLFLSSRGLTGTIPDEIGDLSELLVFDIKNNAVTGNLPNTIAGLTNLTNLRLTNNNFSGSIPSGVWNLNLLEEIDLENTGLAGTIPTTISNLSNLITLNLGGTDISGTIPPSLWNIASLEIINLNNANSLDPWSLPATINNLTNLRWFEVGNSNLTGTLPDSFGTISNLQRFRVENNDLSGSIPSSLSLLTNLQLISFQNNNLSGALPVLSSTGIGNLLAYGNQYLFEDIEPVYTNYTTNATSVLFQPQAKIDTEEEQTVFEGNSFTMSVTGTSSPNNLYQWRKDGVDIPGATDPTYILTDASSTDSGVYDCVITNSVVTSLNLERNTITINVFSQGQRDALIAIYNATDGPNWTNPWDLNLEMDQWAGVILNSFNQVEELQLSNRNLSGVLPTELGDLVNLRNLYISNNNLTGNLPSSISNLINLEILNAGNNSLSGSLPEELGNITTLQEIYFLRNNLSGAIPDSYGNLVNLEILNLLENSIDGTIPSGFSSLSNLRILNVESNAITGNLSWITGLSAIESLNIKSNNFSGSIPAMNNLTELTSINLSRNALTGSPLNVFTNANYQSLDISSNSFDAYSFPNAVGNYTELRLLNLSDSNLTGSIGDVFGNLTQLTTLILNDNNLEGVIPNSLVNVPSLNNLFLSNNNLSGTIPLIPTTNLSIIAINANRFVFENIEAALGHYRPDIGINFNFFGQKNVDTEATISLNEGDNFSISVNATSSINNTYQWRKDGVDISGATNANFMINSVSVSDAGVYDCIINNVIITDLTIGREPITLEVLVSDDDNDGVNNANDLCPDTPEGDIVNTDGCSVDQLTNIDPNDIQVIVTSASCPNVANGEVTISFTEDFVYTVTVTGPGENRTLENISANQDLVINDLAPNTYGICITIPAIPGFEQCYRTVVLSPDALKASKKHIDTRHKKASLSVSGSNYYEVMVNSKSYEFTFNDTSIQTIDITLDQIVNTIEIKTDKTCQGIFKETIFLEEKIYAFLTPSENSISLVGLQNTPKAEITLTDVSGKLVLYTLRSIKDTGEIQVSIDALSSGIYLLHINTETQLFNTKIYKK